MKWIKWTLIGVGGVLIVLIALVVSFLATFDPNAYKAELAATVKRETGRDLAIPGEVSISYFPWLGFETGRVSLGNAKGFGDTPFAEVAGVRVKVEVLPLLRRVLSVDVIELSGLRLDLQKRSNGTSNWDDLAGPPGEAAKPAAGSGGAPPLAALSVGGLRVTDAAVRYRDAQSGQDVALMDVSLLTGKVAPRVPFDVELNAKAAVNQPQVSVAMRMSATVTADIDAKRFAVADLDLVTDLAGEPVPAGALSVALAGNAAADLAAQTAQFSALELKVGPLVAKLDGSVKGLDKTPEFDATLDVPAFDARALMKQLALPPLDTADPDVLKQVAVRAQLAGSPAAIDVKSLAIALDDSQIEASAELRNLGNPKELPRVNAQVNISAINLDRYLPPDAEETAKSDTGGAGDDTPIGLPVELLRGLNARAEMQLGAVTVKKLNASDIAVTLTARDGVVRLEPLSLSLYDGLFKGKTSVDVRGAQPSFAVQAQLSGVQAGPLLADFMGDDKVRGRAEAKLAITTSGETIGALKRGLNGTVALAFADGAVKDFNLAEQLRKAEAKLKKQDYSSSGDQPTDFSAVSVSGVFKDGVLHTDDLDLRAPLLRAGGQGQIDIAAETLNYLATVTLTGTKTGQGGEVGADLKGLPVPVRVQGPFADPKVSLELAKAMQAKAGAAIKEATEAEKARLKAEADQAKAELAEKQAAEKARLQQKADEEKRKAEDALKDKAKNKLKNLLQ